MGGRAPARSARMVVPRRCVPPHYPCGGRSTRLLLLTFCHGACHSCGCNGAGRAWRVAVDGRGGAHGGVRPRRVRRRWPRAVGWLGTPAGGVCRAQRLLGLTWWRHHTITKRVGPGVVTLVICTPPCGSSMVLLPKGLWGRNCDMATAHVRLLLLCVCVCVGCTARTHLSPSL